MAIRNYQRRDINDRETCASLMFIHAILFRSLYPLLSEGGLRGPTMYRARNLYLVDTLSTASHCYPWEDLLGGGGCYCIASGPPLLNLPRRSVIKKPLVDDLSRLFPLE